MKRTEEAIAIENMLQKLSEAYQIAGHEITFKYDNNLETVTAQYFADKFVINVYADSVSACIYDVVKAVQREVL